MASRDLMEGVKALEDTRADYAEAAAYFRGTIVERFANERIRRLVQESGKAYRFRLAAIPVRVISNRVKIAAITGPSKDITQRIEVIRQANDMELQEPHIHRETFMYGDGYVMVWPIDPDEEGVAQVDGEKVDVAPDMALREAGVEITYQSPLACRILYDGNAGRRPRFGIRRWCETTAVGIKNWRAEVWYADRVEPWITGDDEDGTQEDHWNLYAEDSDGNRVPAIEGQNWPLAHDWEEIPIKHARNGLPYGRPEHKDAYGPQDMITKATVTQVMELEGHGWPERARLLDEQSVLETSQDAVPWDEPADAQKAAPGVQVSGRRRGPGTENTYAGTRELIQFPAPKPGELNEPMELWVRLMSTATGVPLWEFDPVGGAQLSGVSRDKADAPLKDMEEDRKRFLLSFWREVWHLALRMDGVVTEPGQIDIQWRPGAVISDPEWWGTAKMRQEQGVPQRQILLEANYLPDDVDAWLEAQEEGMALIAQVDLLERIGAAVQALGAGVAVGMLTQEQAAATVERVIGIQANHKPKAEPAPQPALPPGQPDPEKVPA